MEDILERIYLIENQLSSLKELVKDVRAIPGEIRKGPQDDDGKNWIEALRIKMGPWGQKPLVVLSLFDGIGGVWVALSLLGIPFKGYSCEVNPNAVQLLIARHPSLQHLGDVMNLRQEQIKEPVDLIVGGFPCQDLSAMGKKVGLHGERSKLFFELLRAIKMFKPTWFLVENVASMSWVERDEISKHLRCIPIEIDSQEITPSKRRRFYWTNIPHPKTLPGIAEHYSTSLQSCLDDGIALEQKIGCILGQNPFGSRVQLQPIVQDDGLNLRYIKVTEVEKVMGYTEGYTELVYRFMERPSKTRGGRQPSNNGSSLPSQKAQNFIRWQLLGNSFSVHVIAYLLSSLVNESMRKKVRPILLPASVREEDCSAMDKGEIWALYNDYQRPNWYALIEERSGDRFSPLLKGYKKSILDIKVRFLEIASEFVSGEIDEWSPNRGAGRYIIGDSIDTQNSWLSFSHRVTGFMKIEHGYFIYPHRGEIWALYERHKRSSPWFVLVTESRIDKSNLNSVKPGKEGFVARGRLLQATLEKEVFRVSDKILEYCDILQFSFMVPYYVRSQANTLKLEFSNKGRKMLSEERSRKKAKTDESQFDASDEMEFFDDDEMDLENFINLTD